MNIVIYYNRTPHHMDAATCFGRGLAAHGLDYTFSDCYNPILNADLAVFWAHRRRAVIEYQKQNGRDYLVMERGYFGDRFKMTSLGFNGLNGRAQFHNENSPPDRWEKHGVELTPWKPIGSGEYILVLGQVSGDASIEGVDIKRWAINTCRDLKRRYPDPVVLRPHPLARDYDYPDDIEVMTTRPLAEDLRDAVFAVTYNSTSGVDAIISGTPVVAIDEGSMVYSMAAHDIYLDPPRYDRTQFFYDLAYCQWTWKEIETGEAWEHLKKIMR